MMWRRAAVRRVAAGIARRPEAAGSAMVVVAMAYEGLALRQKNGCHIPSLNPHCCHSEELENDLDTAAAIGADM